MQRERFSDRKINIYLPNLKKTFSITFILYRSIRLDLNERKN